MVNYMERVEEMSLLLKWVIWEAVGSKIWCLRVGPGGGSGQRVPPFPFKKCLEFL